MKRVLKALFWVVWAILTFYAAIIYYCAIMSSCE